MIGTPFLPKDQKSKRLIDKLDRKQHDQVPTDKQGRKRFHGAFTGGFSAGFWNTCGSKQGWTPAEFKSSRDTEIGENKRAHKKATIADYMDEEDFGDHQAGVTITATKGYQDPIGQLEKKIIRENIGKNDILGYAPSELIEGPLTKKSDSFGIGYKPTQQDIQKNLRLNQVLNKSSDGKSSSKNKIQMSQFNQDQVYCDDNSKDEYQFEMDVEKQDTVKNKVLDLTSIPEPIFSFQEKIESIKTVQNQKIQVPKDYNPFKYNIHSYSSQREIQNRFQSRKSKKMDPNMRGNIINDESLRIEQIKPNPRAETQLRNKFYSQQPKQVIPPKCSSLQNKFSIPIPFLQQKAKMIRFQAYIAERQGQYMQPIFANMMTGSQIKKQKRQFKELYQKNLKLSGHSINNNIDSKEKINEQVAKASERQISYWTPSELLCKRFGILNRATTAVNKIQEQKHERRNKKVQFFPGQIINRSERKAMMKTGNQFFNSLQSEMRNQEEEFIGKYN